MKYQYIIKNNKNKGAAMIIVVFFFIFISISILIGIINPVIGDFKVAGSTLNSRKAFFLAESGTEDALYRLKNSMSISGNERIDIGDDSTTTVITDTGTNQKTIESLGDSSLNQRKVSLSLTTASGVSFSYGVQVGQGGIDLQGSSGINGNVYANGPITGSTASFISGTAISGNSPASVSDQSNGVSATPTTNVTFANANATQDVAQSFQLSTSSPLNKVQLYIKKVGAPSNATVKIMNNSGGNVGSTLIASGILSASNVTTSYGWVEVSFSTNPLLNTNTTYWLVIDASTSSSKYYVIGATGSNSYSNGNHKIGQLGGTWTNSDSSLDSYFKIYLGGVYGLIQGSSLSQWNQLSVGTSGSGSAQAHTVNYTEATGLIYCQSGTGNNKSCTPQTDPSYIAYPVSDSNIEQWKNEALVGGVYSGTYNTPSYGNSTIGPKKINGDLNVSGSHTLYLSGTIWVTGNITVSGSAKIVLASSYGNSSGVVVSDGWLSLSGSGQLNGSGQAGSYILFTTTSNCDISYCAHNAIEISGAAGSVVLNAQKGTISFSGSASAKEATAYKIVLTGATTVNYESGLANMNFHSGPSGTWNVNSWKEIE